MEYRNFSVSRSKGKFYLKEKTPTEGYEEVTYGTDGTKKTYHKYFNNVKGLPTHFGVKEVVYEGRTLSFLELSLVEGDVTNKISVSLKNKGGYTEEVRVLLSALNSYKNGEPVTINPNVSKSTGKNGKVYENFNLYINYDNIKGADGKNASTGFIPYTDIPKPLKSDDGMGGIAWDFTPVNKFFYSKLQEVEARFNGTSTTPAPAPVVSAPAVAETLPATPAAEYDDLPF